MSDFIVGLTGGIASGKSALAAEFERLGVPVIDADVVARQVVAPGPILDAIVDLYGPGVLLPNGMLNRQVLREIVFADDAKRKALESITHPVIRAKLKCAAEAAEGPYAIVAIPLLAEAGGRTTYPWLSRILVVDVPVAVQRTRLMLRDGSTAALADRMIAAQALRHQRLRLADDVVTNDRQPAQLHQESKKLNAYYIMLAETQAQKRTELQLQK
ncbi:dephospho-CoA kinase [Xanthomonas arboricola]|uniref:dephospho-CoA kinase n=1 Tax=Xanthomonas euroxanthea TaxID=2259622 RepID=UPI001615E5F9|nr:dephospho-CoA kinase [Xanthomonas euroxanthea]MBB3814521.1 dephospho-CoA kinase [Xanthomonas euroxanthea]